MFRPRSATPANGCIIAVVPILLGRGERLWDGLEGLEKDYAIEANPSPSGVTYVTFTRARS